MNEEEARESYFELQVIEEQMKQLQQQISQLEGQISDFEEAIKSLGELRGKTEEETLIPLSLGIYAKAKLQDTKKFMVNVGAGVAVEKSREDTIKIITKQIAEMRQYREQMLNGLQLLGSRAEEIEKQVTENVQVS